MFAKSVVYSSILALAMSKPIARRDDHFSSSGFNVVPLVGVHDGSFFDLNSHTIAQFDTGVHSFDGWGGIPSLVGFDQFHGVNDFCGIQNIFVQENVVTCQVTQVSVIQQHLAIVAEYVKKVILTQSCETEAQVLLFSQWMGNLVSFNQDLRRVNGRAPTFDSVIASQLPSLVDISGNINTVGFDFTGSSIGSHGVTVLGGNWHEVNSPVSVGLTWDRVILAAGPSIHLGGDCTSCNAPVVFEHHPVVETIAHTFVEPIHTPVFHETQVFTTHVTEVFNPHETQVFNPHKTVVFNPHETHEVFVPHVTQVFNPHETQVFNPHETVFEHAPVIEHTTEVFNEHVNTVDEHTTEVFNEHVNTVDEHTTEEVFRKGSETSSADVSTATDNVDIQNTEVSSDVDVADASADDATSDGFPDTPDDPALGRRSLPPAVARRAWSSRRRV